jgi:uncharacterized protein
VPNSSPATFLVDHLTVHASSARRWLLLGVGWVGFTLGVIGVLLPVMPAMPFFLVSAWGFSKSSPALETWLMKHPLVGPSLDRFRRHRVVPMSFKLVSVGSMLAAFSVSFALPGVPLWARVTQGTLIALGSVFLLQFPSKEPSPASVASAQDAQVGSTQDQAQDVPVGSTQNDPS